MNPHRAGPTENSNGHGIGEGEPSLSQEGVNLYRTCLRVSLHHRAVACLQMRDYRLLVSNKTLNEWPMERRGQKKENVYMDRLKRKWGDNKKRIASHGTGSHQPTSVMLEEVTSQWTLGGAREQSHEPHCGIQNPCVWQDLEFDHHSQIRLLSHKANYH